MVGYVAASYVAQSVCSLTGAEHTLMANAQAIVIGLCFANGLSPVTGVYGWLAGVLFGMIHYTFVTCVPLLHGAFCLYNGGFTAAFTCFLFIPVLETCPLSSSEFQRSHTVVAPSFTSWSQPGYSSFRSSRYAASVIP